MCPRSVSCNQPPFHVPSQKFTPCLNPIQITSSSLDLKKRGLWSPCAVIRNVQVAQGKLEVHLTDSSDFPEGL